ncbi:MAG: N-acetylmuramoyl-L-alanine amidase [Alphaproteobacteria bacterium]
MLSPVMAAAPAIAIVEDGAVEAITIVVPNHNPHKVFLLEKPYRLVVDIPRMHQAPNVSMPAAYRGNLVRSVRFGQFSESVSRFVFDLSRPVQVVSASSESMPARLVVRLSSGGAGKGDEKVIQKKKKSRPIIMIDAGHGGHDPGTIGNHKTREKVLVLEYARSLRYVLEQSGRYHVVLTRDNDEFITLRDRVALARKADADMFISLHADSAPKSTARGLSVYTLSEKASDAEAAALAERENSAGALSSIDLSNEREDVADILISLAQRETNNFSATLADFIVESCRDRGVPLLPNSHRFAGFAVLKAPDIPSVLVETGFLSNAHEEEQLKSGSYRRKVVQSIAHGIDAFFAHKRELEGE